MSSTMHRAALSQDAIGWREFMEGKVSKEIAAIQDAHCATSPCRMNGSDWMKHFISHLLHLSHSQWICRNITLHDKLRGTLFLRKREDVLKELDSLIETDPEELPAERRFLLEFDFDSLYRSSFENQTYWVRAIKAARRAGQLAAARRGRMGALLHVDVPSALVLTPLLSLASFRLTWESARRLPSLIVGLPLLCSPLHLTIHVISVSGNQTRV